MILLNSIAAILCSLLCVCWFVFYTDAIRILFKIRYFEKENPPIPQNWPPVSIVIAACNEADHIKNAIMSLTRLDYPNLEIIAVNDRSTDKTGNIIDETAENISNFIPLHIKNLPAGWLGKVNAMNQGLKIAKGKWVLFTDGDVQFQNGSIKKAIALALCENADHLTIMPVPESPSFWEKVTLRSFGILFLQGTRATEAEKPESKSYVGIGAFNLVKKEAFDKTKGFEWLKMEVGDDLGIGLLMKNAGFKTVFTISQNKLKLIWYGSLGSMFRGLEKNLFGTMSQYNILKAIIQIVFLTLYCLAPFLAVFIFKNLFIRSLGLSAIILHIFTAIIAAYKLDDDIVPSLLAPVGTLFFPLMLIRSAYFCMKRNGICWRGTTYSIKELKNGQRVKTGF